MSDDKRQTRKRRNVEWLLGLGALVVALGAGLWFWSNKGTGARHLDGPTKDAVLPEDAPSAALETAAAVPAATAVSTTDDRVAVMPDVAPQVELEVDETALPVGAGSISGNFLRPGNLARDAQVTLHAIAQVEGDTPKTLGPLEQELPISDGWSLTELGPGTYRLKATVKLDEHLWTSEVVERTLAEGANLSGINLSLVEYGVEGLILSTAGLGVAGVSVETSWMAPSDELQFPTEDSFRPITSLWSNDGNGISTRSVLGFSSEEGEPFTIRIDEPSGRIVDGAIRSEVFQAGITIDWSEALETAVREIDYELPEVTDTLNSLISSRLIERMVMEEEEGDVEVVEGDPVPVTDASGRYFLALPGPGRYGLKVNGHEIEILATEQSVEVELVRPIAIQDFEVVRTARLSGRVTAFSGEVPDGINCFLRLDGNTDVDVVNADGGYSFERLRPGLYDFYARGGGDSGQDFSHHMRLQIDEGENAEYDALLDPSFRIDGQLEGGDGLYAHLRLTAIGTTNPSLSRTAKVGIDGSFTFEGLYAGEYQLHVRHPDVEGQHGLTEDVVFFVDANSSPEFQKATLRRKDS